MLNEWENPCVASLICTQAFAEIDNNSIIRVIPLKNNKHQAPLTEKDFRNAYVTTCSVQQSKRHYTYIHAVLNHTRGLNSLTMVIYRTASSASYFSPNSCLSTDRYQHCGFGTSTSREPAHRTCPHEPHAAAPPPPPPVAHPGHYAAGPWAALRQWRRVPRE